TVPSSRSISPHGSDAFSLILKRPNSLVSIDLSGCWEGPSSMSRHALLRCCLEHEFLSVAGAFGQQEVLKRKKWGFSNARVCLCLSVTHGYRGWLRRHP